MRVYSEDSGEMVEIEARTPSGAAKIAHAQSEDGSGNAGTYRVEAKPGEWERFTVSTRIETVHTTRSKGTCGAPEVDDE